jgi:hypothetical protein
MVTSKIPLWMSIVTSLIVVCMSTVTSFIAIPMSTVTAISANVMLNKFDHKKSTKERIPCTLYESSQNISTNVYRAVMYTRSVGVNW